MTGSRDAIANSLDGETGSRDVTALPRMPRPLRLVRLPVLR
jgi:hypothetical protein